MAAAGRDGGKMPDEKSVKSAFESMMFVWGSPLDAKTAADVVGIEKKEARQYFKELQREYEESGRGIVIRETDGAFQFVTRAENFDCLRRLCTPVRERRLTQAALEVLAIIAYKQPVTRGEIDAIRGVKCDRLIEGLVKKNLIEETGRSNAVGRPILYGTTKNFLRHFNLENLNELPEIEDIESAVHDHETGSQISINLDFEA
jgi:segregation and condensation protein B